MYFWELGKTTYWGGIWTVRSVASKTILPFLHLTHHFWNSQKKISAGAASLKVTFECWLVKANDQSWQVSSKRGARNYLELNCLRSRSNQPLFYIHPTILHLIHFYCHSYLTTIDLFKENSGCHSSWTACAQRSTWSCFTFIQPYSTYFSSIAEIASLLDHPCPWPLLWKVLIAFFMDIWALAA